MSKYVITAQVVQRVTYEVEASDAESAAQIPAMHPDAQIIGSITIRQDLLGNPYQKRTHTP